MFHINAKYDNFSHLDTKTVNANYSIYNSDIVEILKGFSNKDLKKFYQYLESPFFDVKPFTIPLLKTITRNHPVYKELELDKKKIFARAFPKKKYSDGILRKGLSLLTQYLYDFTTIRFFKNNEPLNYATKLQAIFNSKFKSHIKKFENKYEKEILRKGITKDTYLHLSNSTGIFKSYIVTTESAKKSVSKVFKEIDEFLIYFLFKFAINRIEYKTISSYFNLDNPDSIAMTLIRNLNWEKFLEELFTGNKDRDLMRDIVYHLHKLISSNDKKTLMEYYEFILKNFNEFEIGTKYYLYFPALFQASFAKFDSTLEYLEFRHNCHKKYIANKNHYDDQDYLIPLHEFLPLIADALTFNDFKFAAEVKDKYLTKIEPSRQMDASIFYDASVNYKKGRYKEALNFFSKLSAKDLMWFSSSRFLKLHCYYELDNTEDALTYLKTLKDYTNSSKNYPGVYKSNTHQFYSFYKELLLNKNNYSIDDWKFMLGKVKKSKEFIHLIWITEKIEERIQACQR